MTIRQSQSSYFGQGYYRLYRHYLLPAEQTQAEAGFLVRRLQPRPGERWLDLPCGYGRHLLALAAARPDLRLSGGDLNRAYLREPGLRQAAGVAACDMRRLPFADASFDAVLNLLNSFGYYPPGDKKLKLANVKAQMLNPHARNPQPLDDRATLAECARVLRRGGRLVLDLANRRALIDLVRRQPAIRYAGGECEVLERFALDGAGEVLRNETIWRWPDGCERARYRLRLYTPGQIRRLLERAGFEGVKIHGGFDGRPLDTRHSDRMLVLARRG